MKLYAFVENIESNDDSWGDSGKHICQIFTTKEEVTKDIMDGIKRNFNSFKEYGKGHKYEWDDRIRFSSPEIVEIETGKFYTIHDFYSIKLNFQDFIDFNDPIFEEIDLFNYDSIENKNKYEIEKKRKSIDNLKIDIEILESQIKELQKK